jgi:Protein of unknown function (DUF3347).
MKTFLSILLVSVSICFVACRNDNSSSKESSIASTETASQDPKINNSDVPKNTGTINDVITHYLHLKNALTNDNGSEGAAAAKEINEALTKVGESSLTPEQKRIYDDLKDDIKEHSEHIGANGSDIKHQREHFDLLSKDIIDLVKATGSSQTLYRDFCPMYNDKKGASWLSETKEIKNPYYGKEMPKCGEVKEEIKAKG